MDEYTNTNKLDKIGSVKSAPLGGPFPASEADLPSEAPSPPLKAPFDPIAAIRELVASQPQSAGPKLSFQQKCAAFFAMQQGARRSVVGKAYGLSQSAISHLANCLADPPPGKQRHYPDVAAEFLRLGEEAFGRAFYTEDDMFRVARVKLKAPTQTNLHGRYGSNPSAAKYALENYGVVAFDFIYNGQTKTTRETYCVKWWDDLPESEYGEPPIAAGWYYSPCDADGRPFRPDDRPDQEKPFRTSAEAFDALYARVGEPNPRRGPGRPPKRA